MPDHQIVQYLHHIVVLRLLLVLFRCVEVLVHIAQLKWLDLVGAPDIHVLRYYLAVLVRVELVAVGSIMDANRLASEFIVVGIFAFLRDGFLAASIATLFCT